MLPLVRLLDGQGTVVIRSSEATDGVGHDARLLTRKSAEDAGTSLGRDVRNRLAEIQLPPADVPPLAVLEADVLVDAHALEAQRFVDPDAGVVREGYPGDEQ